MLCLASTPNGRAMVPNTRQLGASISPIILLYNQQIFSSSSLTFKNEAASPITLVLRQAEAALADYVLLNFAGAARDSELQTAYHPALPSRGFGHRRHRLAQLCVRTQHLGRKVRDSNAQLRAEQLEHRALRSRQQAAQLAGQRAQLRVLRGLAFDGQ